MKVAVVGAAGYAGGELLRLLLGHPEILECTATSRSQAGKPVGAVHPALAGFTDLRFAALAPGEAAHGADVVFLALEHGESSRIIGEVLDQDPRLVIDLAADFRIRDRELYQRFYGPHPAANYLDRFTYGLADVRGRELFGARAIAAPGCFATAAQLALYPLASLSGIAPSLFAITGSSGAGMQPRPTTHHPARANNVFAYSVLSHRHEAEILEQWRQWTGAAGSKPRLMAHSGPFVRGIYLTLAATRHDLLGDSAQALFAAAYRGRPFVRLLECPPELSHAVGGNYALVHVAESPDGQEIQVSVAIDNLVKGAAGQAVQAMNLSLGMPEDTGLKIGGGYPC